MGGLVSQGGCVAGAKQARRTHVDCSCGVHLGRCTRGVGACVTGVDWFCRARACHTQLAVGLRGGRCARECVGWSWGCMRGMCKLVVRGARGQV